MGMAPQQFHTIPTAGKEVLESKNYAVTLVVQDNQQHNLNDNQQHNFIYLNAIPKGLFLHIVACNFTVFSVENHTILELIDYVQVCLVSHQVYSNATCASLGHNKSGLLWL